MSLEPLLASSAVIQLHVATAVLALVLGGLVLFRRKGTALHRLLGRAWVGLMVVVTGSSFLISEGSLPIPFGPIHALSVLTLFSLWHGVGHARRGRIMAHRATMQLTYVGSLVIAGAFTLLPGRRMHAVLFGPGAGWTPSLIALALIFSVTGWALWRQRHALWRMV